MLAGSGKFKFSPNITLADRHDVLFGRLVFAPSDKVDRIWSTIASAFQSYFSSIVGPDHLSSVID